MDEASTTRAGWYPDPKLPGTLRYWDGSVWTDHVAPITPAPGNKSFTNMLMIVLGILIAAAVLWVVYALAHSQDGLKCESDNADRVLAGQPSKDCG